MRPLEGYRILELSMMGAAPYGVRELTDMGAEVIKIEDTGSGDRSRLSFTWGAEHVMPPHHYNYMYESANRGKRSVALDLRQEKGRQAFYRLVPHCAAMVSSLRKPALKRIGADYETLKAINPSLVYVHVGAFGPLGPDADLPGQDLTTQARSGLLNMMRHEPGDEPLSWGVFGLADMICAIQVAYATCLGLMVRDRTGQGQEVNVSILGATMMASEMVLEPYLHTGKEPHPVRRMDIKNPLRSIYPCGDGKWIALGMSESDRFWERFCKALGKPELAVDPRFLDRAQREKHHGELTALLDSIFKTKSQDSWYEALAKHDCIATKVQTYPDLVKDSQITANEYVATVQHPQHGPYRTLGTTVALSRTPGQVQQAAPELGQHTEEVLTGLAGYSREEVEDLVRAGVAVHG
ncbi:MAG: CoA transferase [Chloroflexi bacterium]|nr:CoA transferase [Chloroflexota bacterium]